MINITKSIPFKNWTKTDFKHKYDGTEYTFEAGGTYMIPADIASFFARHLAIREMFEEGGQNEALPEVKLKSYIDNCFPNKDQTPSNSVFERIDKVELKFEPSKDSDPIPENKTEKDVQNIQNIQNIQDEDEEEKDEDEGNSNAIPKLKSVPSPLASPDSQYVE